MMVVIVCTMAAMLSKEQAVTVAAVCAMYDVILYHQLVVGNAGACKVFTQYAACVFQTYFWRLLEGLSCLFACGLSLIVLRLHLMGNHAPVFAPSDNPASATNSTLARTLTFHFLPAFNVWLLLLPSTLSFDWSMGAIPLVESPWDVRNMATAGFYVLLALSSRSAVKMVVICGRAALACLARQVTKAQCTCSCVGSQAELCLSGTGPSSPSLCSLPSHQHTMKIKCSSNLKLSEISSGQQAMQNVNSEVLPQTSTPLAVLAIALSILVFPYIPASNLFFYVGFVVAERVLYIPSMGFCLMVGYGAQVLIIRAGSQTVRCCVYASAALLVVLFSVRTCLRNWDWQTEESLYRSGIPINPAKAWGNLANILSDKGQVVEAEEAYLNALVYRGNMADTHYNLGVLLQKQGRSVEAIHSYRQAIACRPKLTVAHLNLAILTADSGDVTAAAQIYRHCADLDTSGLKDPRLHESTQISCLYNLARLYLDHGDLQESEKTFREALRRMPAFYPAHSLQNMLGELYMRKGSLEQAKHWYNEALKSKPNHLPAHLTMAKLCQHKGMLAEADQWFEKARAIDPTDSTVDHYQGQMYMAQSKYAIALHYLHFAVGKSPSNFAIILDTANCYRQAGDNIAAEQLYRKATHLKPMEATAHMNLGAMLHVNGRLGEAEESYLTALSLNPDDSLTQDNLAKLRRLTSSTGIDVTW